MLLDRLKPGDWLHDCSPGAGYWGRVTEIHTSDEVLRDAFGDVIARIVLHWYKWDPDVEKPMTDFIHARHPTAFENIDAILRPARNPVAAMHLRAILLHVLPQRAPMPLIPVMFKAAGFDVIHYSVGLIDPPVES